MSEWLADKFTDWLASPRGLVQGIVITVPWLVLVFLGLDQHGFWFLFFATLVSFLTQFPLAYANRRTEQHTLKLMRLLVAMAEKQGEQLDDIQEEIVPLVPVPPPVEGTPKEGQA